VRFQVDQMVQRLDLVKREELDAALEVARRAREGQEALEARVAALEARLAVAAAPPAAVQDAPLSAAAAPGEAAAGPTPDTV
jgi:BMFP domain-containing protein YqiC